MLAHQIKYLSALPLRPVPIFAPRTVNLDSSRRGWVAPWFASAWTYRKVRNPTPHPQEGLFKAQFFSLSRPDPTPLTTWGKTHLACRYCASPVSAQIGHRAPAVCDISTAPNEGRVDLYCDHARCAIRYVGRFRHADMVIKAARFCA